MAPVTVTGVERDQIRQRFLPQVHSEAALELARAVKRALDPGNVFGIGIGACGR